MDQPPCPVVPEEEKTRVGTENRGSKTYKKKCIGRMRKQVGDYSLLTGLPSLASEAYIAAIEYLKSANDLLWLSAAYEGLSCAAMSIKYNETEDRLRRQAVIHRVSTMTPDEYRDHQEKTQHTLGYVMMFTIFLQIQMILESREDIKGIDLTMIRERWQQQLPLLQQHS